MAFVAPVAAGAGRATAGRAAGSRATARRGGARRRPATRPAPAPAAETNLSQLDGADAINEELQRRRAAAAEKRSAPAEPELVEHLDDEPAPPAPRELRGRLAAPMEPASSGAGVVLGALLWVLVSNYIEGGTPQVRRLLRAKFLNKTGEA